jgi:hypothetical protein
MGCYCVPLRISDQVHSLRITCLHFLEDFLLVSELSQGQNLVCLLCMFITLYRAVYSLWNSLLLSFGSYALVMNFSLYLTSAVTSCLFYLLVCAALMIIEVTWLHLGCPPLSPHLGCCTGLSWPPRTPHKLLGTTPQETGSSWLNFCVILQKKVNQQPRNNETSSLLGTSQLPVCLT